MPIPKRTPIAPEDGDGLVPDELAELYRRHAPAVLRRGRRFLPPDEAEELVHEVFLKLVEEPRRLRGEASPATWMYRVATHLCIDRLRKRARQARLTADFAATRAPHDPGQTPEARAFLDALWSTLDDELAMIGVLYHLDGMTTADIGRTLGVSDRTVANRLARLASAARAAAGDEPGGQR
ncbi:MAG: sigma-70 family RNA polymerase sigma factor [Deltaproteobacteria bacterium]|nr:sigma-70 family RNA polymerase sigma factor [Deltaproteobacteria bacterium]